jgi:hypothetical protein
MFSRKSWENLETQKSQVRWCLHFRGCDEECSGESRCSLSTIAFFDGTRTEHSFSFSRQTLKFAGWATDFRAVRV